MLLNRTVAATLWPITLADAKEHLRVSGTDEDVLIANVIKAASDQIGEMSGRVLSAETWTVASACFYGRVTLPKSPITAATAIQYYDAAGALQNAVTSDFNVFIGEDYSMIEPKPGAAWPTAQPRPDAVRITFTAGYAICPFALRAAMLLLIGHLYSNREATVVGATVAKLEMAVESHVNTYRLGWAAG